MDAKTVQLEDIILTVNAIHVVLIVCLANQLILVKIAQVTTHFLLWRKYANKRSIQ